MSNTPTLLKVLLSERHWQKFETFCAEYRKAARLIAPELTNTYPSKAQYYRWLSGQLKTGTPYPDACRVLEGMFPQWKASQLFTPWQSQSSASTNDLFAQHQSESLSVEQPAFLDGLLANVPQSFPVEQLGGLWLTCFQFTPESILDVGHQPLSTQDHELRCHADIVRLTPLSDRRMIATNYPPEPRTEGRAVPFRNDIVAELVSRHLIGHWRNTNDTRYFGSLHLAVLPGETVINGYYTSFLDDVKVDTGRWKWVKLDEATLDDARLPQVRLREPASLQKLVDQHSWYDPQLTAADVEQEVS